MNTAMRFPYLSCVTRLFRRWATRLSVCLVVPVCVAGCLVSGPAPRLLQLRPALPPVAAGLKAMQKEQMVVAMPLAGNALDTDAIALLFHDREIRYLAGARWTAPVPRLVQRGVLDGLEVSGAFRGVTDESAGISANVKFLSEVRAFQLRYENEVAPPVAEFTLSARLLDLRTGDIVATRTFQSSVPANGTDALALAAACEAAFAQGLAEIVPWVIATVPAAGTYR